MPTLIACFINKGSGVEKYLWVLDSTKSHYNFSLPQKGSCLFLYAIGIWLAWVSIFLHTNTLLKLMV